LARNPRHPPPRRALPVTLRRCMHVAFFSLPFFYALFLHQVRRVTVHLGEGGHALFIYYIYIYYHRHAPLFPLFFPVYRPPGKDAFPARPFLCQGEQGNGGTCGQGAGSKSRPLPPGGPPVCYWKLLGPDHSTADRSDFYSPLPSGLRASPHLWGDLRPTAPCGL
jgi:hypothetical protein